MNITTTQYAYDTKGMRIIKDGPYGKSIYVDTGYVESSGAGTTTPSIVSNHVFVGNTRVASVVKHKDEAQAATYYFATDHLGSSSVLTTQTGNYHERIEYLPYGEVWIEDSAQSGGYSTPYKFTGKELDKETNLYYFGARYYDARVSRWISTDPALQEGKYFPKPNDFDTEHDFYWYLQQDGSRKLAGLGGVFNAVNMDVYHYANQNPIKLFDTDGKVVYGSFVEINITGTVGGKLTAGMILFDDKNFDIYYIPININPTFGIMFGGGAGGFKASCDTVQDFLNQDWVSIEGSIGILGGEVGISNSKNGKIDIMGSASFGKAKPKIGIQINIYSKVVNISSQTKKITDKNLSLKIFKLLSNKQFIGKDTIDKAIKIWNEKK